MLAGCEGEGAEPNSDGPVVAAGFAVPKSGGGAAADEVFEDAAGCPKLKDGC